MFLLASGFASIIASQVAMASAEDNGNLVGANSSSLAGDYCNAFYDEAKKARVDRQKQEIATLRDDVNSKLSQLTEKTNALESWVKRREAILALAKDSVLNIYSSMDPAAAAGEISKLDELSAAAILQQLKPKKASAILVEMDPKRAATLVAVIAANSKLKLEQKS